MADWPHAPVHRVSENGTYIVTAGTYLKRHVLNSDAKLRLVHDTLLELAEKYAWLLQAWTVLPNHYHFVALKGERSEELSRLTGHLHSITAKELNAIDDRQGRRV
jgi:putative transposase